MLTWSHCAFNVDESAGSNAPPASTTSNRRPFIPPPSLRYDVIIILQFIIYLLLFLCLLLFLDQELIPYHKWLGSVVVRASDLWSTRALLC